MNRLRAFLANGLMVALTLILPFFGWRLIASNQRLTTRIAKLGETLI